MRKLVFVTSFVCLLPVAAAAQEAGAPALLFPGSINFYSGPVAPSEPGNVITSATTEQGLTLWQRAGLSAVAYGDLTLRRDTAGHDWNNNAPITAGVKAVAAGAWGVAQAGLGVNVLANTALHARASRAVSLSYWTAWRGDTLAGALSRFATAYPGHVYASSGYLTAAEPDNWTGAVRVEQGATLFYRRQLATVMFVAAGATRDANRFEWNNRTQLDAGLKFAHPVAGGVVDLSVAERREISRTTSTVRTSPVLSVDLWLGWNPRYSRK